MSYTLLRYPGCKWNKHLALIDNPEIKSYLPQTDLLNKRNLETYIRKYPSCFLKPTLGGGGKGVIKISKHGKYYTLHSSVFKRPYANINRLFNHIQKRTHSKKYIIQQGVELFKINQRPLDFRILLLKPHLSWKYIGIMGKYAGKNRFVTNHARGGRAINLKPALRYGLNYSNKKSKEMEGKLEFLGLNIANSLNNTFANITELGLDVAIDTNEQIWLIEANTKPRFKLFKDHTDPSLYQKIVRATKELRSKQDG